MRKTAYLFAASSQLGEFWGSADPEKEELLRFTV